MQNPEKSPTDSDVNAAGTGVGVKDRYNMLKSAIGTVYLIDHLHERNFFSFFAFFILRRFDNPAVFGIHFDNHIL